VTTASSTSPPPTDWQAASRRLDEDRLFAALEPEVAQESRRKLDEELGEPRIELPSGLVADLL
jgi:hypothetical protein